MRTGKNNKIEPETKVKNTTNTFTLTEEEQRYNTFELKSVGPPSVNAIARIKAFELVAGDELV